MCETDGVSTVQGFEHGGDPHRGMNTHDSVVAPRQFSAEA